FIFNHSPIITLFPITSNIYLMILIILSSGCLPVESTSEYMAPVSMVSRSVVSVNLSLHEKWRISNLFIPHRDTSTIYSNGDFLFYVAHDNNGRTSWLSVIDTTSGSMLWKSDSLPFSENSLAVDERRLFLALSAKILAYDLFTGDVLWETQERLPDRTQYKMYAKDDHLIVYSAEDSAPENTMQIVRVYDSRSGILESIKSETISQDASYLLKTNTNDYWTDRTAIWSIDNQTKQQKWSMLIDGPVQYQPLLIGNKLVFASGIFSDVTAIDNDTGNQVWKYSERIISNLTMESGIIYAIREDAAVVAINLFTGEELGYITVTPGFTEESGSRVKSYLVAAANGMVFAYYGDSQELIAFSK
ncbi:MAG: PQQ-binding-like beta-propeller repeat protein, partial [Chloroflexota bacterium]